MLVKEWSCYLKKYSFEVILFLSLPTAQNPTHAITTKGRSSCANFKWA
jgi:hypothetical protein